MQLSVNCGDLLDYSKFFNSLFHRVPKLAKFLKMKCFVSLFSHFWVDFVLLMTIWQLSRNFGNQIFVFLLLMYLFLAYKYSSSNKMGVFGSAALDSNVLKSFFINVVPSSEETSFSPTFYGLYFNQHYTITCYNSLF